MKIKLSNFPDFDSLKIEIELDSASDFHYDMNWERPAEHVEIEIFEDDMFGADREFEYGFKHNKCIKYKRKQRPDSQTSVFTPYELAIFCQRGHRKPEMKFSPEMKFVHRK